LHQFLQTLSEKWITHVQETGYVETFNGSLRDECLNVYWFASMAEAGAAIEACRLEHNVSLPHMAHGDSSPREFAWRSRHLADRPSAKGAED